MPGRFEGKSFVELGITESNYVVVCVIIIKKKNNNKFRPAGPIK
jgi:hypothetical protein